MSEERARRNARQTERRRNRVAEGRCHHCSRPAVPGGVCCELHVLRQQARKHLGAESCWPDLYDLLERQGHVCACSGETLFIGVNASIDHIVPRALGGPDEIGNLRWVSIAVNVAKSSMLHSDFVRLCLAVVQHCGAANDNGGER